MTVMKIRTTAFIALLFFAAMTAASAQPHNNISFSAGFNTEKTFGVRANYHYMFNEYLGVGAGAFCNWEAGSSSRPHGERETVAGHIKWSSYSRVKRGGATVSAILRMPFAGDRLSAELEPAWMVSNPYAVQTICYENTDTGEQDWEGASARGGQWSTWLVRAGFNWHITGNIAANVSYSLTGFDTYSVARHMEYQGTPFSGFYPQQKNLLHGFSLGVALAF